MTWTTKNRGPAGESVVKSIDDAMTAVLAALFSGEHYSEAPMFPFAEYWWLYLVLTAFLGVLFIADSKKQSPLRREAILWMGIAAISALVLLSRL